MTAEAVNINQLLERMTLEEKVSMLAGASAWITEPVERLNIPAIKVTDGPNGARGDNLFTSNATAACFPVGIALAATWNTDLLQQVGKAIAEEAKTKGARVLLAPTVNIHRSPLNGRNFECYSEDPYLTAQIGVAYIKGVQSQGIAATIKHYVGNESEFERQSISSEIGERALREIYLPPFKAAVREAQAWAVMSAYNALNGVHCSANAYTLQQILRDEWGFDGIVMSDWFGTRTTGQAVNAGLDLEMPGPTRWRGDKLLAAVQAGEVSEEKINERVTNMLRLIERVGAFEDPSMLEEQAVDRPEHRALIRRAGAESIVLLKNNDLLPITPDKVKSIAIIGPNAKTAQIMGGGSAQLSAHYRVSPFEGISNHAKNDYELNYELGTVNHLRLPIAEPEQAFEVNFFNTLNFEGDPVVTEHVQELNYVWAFGAVPDGVNAQEFSVRMEGEMTAEVAGEHRFSVAGVGKLRIFVDDVLICDNWDNPVEESFLFGFGSGEAFGAVNLDAGQTIRVRAEFSCEPGSMFSAIRVGYEAPIPADSIERAAKAAAEADVALVFVGLSSEWESEGEDRPDMELVKDQNALVKAVAAANPNTIVVLQSGSPVTMPWFNDVSAVLQAWYPGQECGNAIADVLFGEVTPSGKLPQTFPARLEDNPAYLNYPGDNGRVVYGEGIFVGYRYYEMKRIQPALPFGFGLSYTTFEYSNLRLSKDNIGANESVDVMVDVTNSGSRIGQEVVQVYVSDVQASVMRPEKELKGFAKVELAPGETKTVTITLNRDSFAFYHDGQRRWVVEEGTFNIKVGSSSADIHAETPLTVSETFHYDSAGAAQYGLNTPIHRLMQDERVCHIMEAHMGEMINSPQFAAARDMSFNQIYAMADVLTPEQLAGIEMMLANITDG